ncbi:MAG: hypothetical protein ACJARN_000381, partial [Arenicella sp.]
NSRRGINLVNNQPKILFYVLYKIGFDTILEFVAVTGSSIDL